MTDEIAKALSDTELKGRAWDLKARELGLKPGGLVPGTQSWVPWIKEDLDPTQTITFVAQDVLGTQGGNFYDDLGKAFVIDLNGLRCLIRVHQLNTINRFFYSRYEAMVYGNIQAETFKKGGSDPAPWQKWFYEPNAATFGMDIDGRYLRDPRWYELDKDGIPVKINNMKALAELFFAGDLDFKFTKAQLLELVFTVYKMKLVTKIKKIFGRK